MCNVSNTTPIVFLQKFDLNNSITPLKLKKKINIYRTCIQFNDRWLCSVEVGSYNNSDSCHFRVILVCKSGLRFLKFNVNNSIIPLKVKKKKLTNIEQVFLQGLLIDGSVQ